jgi:hypothetical protein
MICSTTPIVVLKGFIERFFALGINRSKTILSRTSQAFGIFQWYLRNNRFDWYAIISSVKHSRRLSLG